MGANVSCLCFEIFTDLFVYVFFIRTKSFQAHHFRLLHHLKGLVQNRFHFHCCCLDCYQRRLILRLHQVIAVKLVILIVLAIVIALVIISPIQLILLELITRRFLLSCMILLLLQQIQTKSLLRILHFCRKRSKLEQRDFQKNLKILISKLLPFLHV